MMTPVGRLVLVRSVDRAPPGRRDGLGDDAGAGRPDHRPAGRRLHHHLRDLALDLPHQRADRPDRDRAGDCATSRTCGSRGWSGSTSSAWCWPGLGVGGLAFGLSVAGLGILPTWIVIALVAAGAVADDRLCDACAPRRRRRCSISRSCALPTFRANVIGGSLFRIGIGSLPFLLPLMLQLGFHLLAAPVRAHHVHGRGRRLRHEGVRRRAFIRRFGFRKRADLIGLLSSAFTACCAFFTPATPFAIMIGVLLIGGFFRSLQFTATNTIAYADVEPQRMSRATSLVSVAQQLSISAGVAIGALAVETVDAVSTAGAPSRRPTSSRLPAWSARSRRSSGDRVPDAAARTPARTLANRAPIAAPDASDQRVGNRRELIRSVARRS